MTYPIPIAIKTKNYKSYGEIDIEGFDELKRINVVIGRNNAGKSALIDLINYTINPADITRFGHKGRPPEVFVTKPLLEQEIRQIFPDNTSGGVIGGNHFEYGSRWLGKPITISLKANETTFVSIEPPFDNEAITNDFGRKLGGVFVNPLRGRIFRRLIAERNIVPETDSGGPNITESGQGATNLIQNFLHKDGRDPGLVEEKLLSALNEIFNPDAQFKRITARQLESTAWEIFLEEENKGDIRLSNSGSGLKTIILVLISTLLIPIVENRPLKDYIFAFEELENNLHPGLQRRLLAYLRKTSVDSECCFVFTTHSNVIIDLFSKDEEAQIIHITHNGEYAKANKVKTYIESRGILDDLDVRASDLLQANGIVWLEGPSDRLYFNRWIELWTDGKLKEGTHYQCVFYGGRLLAHLSAHQEDEQQETIDILNVNKNAFLMIDSDKDSEADTLNATKQRMITEIQGVGGKTWVTAGREVENYVPAILIAPFCDVATASQVGKFVKFDDYLNRLKSGEGKKYLNNKVLFAEKIIPNLTKVNLEVIMDIKERIEEAVVEIKRWNNLS